MAKSIAEQLAELEAQRQNLIKQETALRDAEKEKNRLKLVAIGEQIDKLPAKFNVENLEVVQSLIRQRIRGTLGSVASGVTGSADGRKARVNVPDAEKAVFLASLTEFGGTKQRSQVMKDANVTSGTVFNWIQAERERRKALAVTTPASPVVSPTVSAPSGTVAA